MRRLTVGLALALLATSCGGGDEAASDEQVLSYLRATNLLSVNFPWTASLAEGRTKRWDIETDGPIPVKLNDSDLAAQAAAKIEATLGRALFDLSSIAAAPDETIRRGIIVSEGTAVGPGGRVDGSTCGNVSALPATTNYPDGFYDENGRIRTRLYVNLSSAECTASLDIAIHELGHALGLGRHFPGFGSLDAIIGPPFWQVLSTLYANKVGTPAEDLHIDLIVE